MTAYTSGPSNTCGKTKLNFFGKFEIVQKTTTHFQISKLNEIYIYIYIIAKQLSLSQYSINKSFPQQKLASFQEKDKEKDKLTSIIFLTPIVSIRVDGSGPPTLIQGLL